MMQGDAYNLGINILNNAGNPVTPADISDLEITIGNRSKTYKRAELTYEDGVWMYPITQQDSFRYHPGSVKAQVRVVWGNGVIEGHPLYGVRMNESLSKEVL